MDPTHLPSESDELNGTDRRGFLRSAAASAPLFALGSAAFSVPTLFLASGAAAQAGGSTTTTAAPDTVLPTPDLELLRFLESIERAGAAAAGAIADTRVLDASLTELCRQIGRHHTDEADALRTLIEADPVGGVRYEKLPAEPNPVLAAELDTQLADLEAEVGEARTEGLLTVLYDLERSTTGTYVFAMGVLETQLVAATVATILPVHSQEAVVLGQILGLPAEDDLPTFERDTPDFPASTYALD